MSEVAGCPKSEVDEDLSSVEKVSLVGAGPGKPELITVKGRRLLETADVIVHDRLINNRLLSMSRPDAELVDVGKVPGRAGRRQSDINSFLISKARQGKRVVRLKGGDPFVFGRGGEEADALAAAGVPFEVVPGVTSAVAAPALRGDTAHAQGICIILYGRHRHSLGHEWAGCAGLALPGTDARHARRPDGMEYPAGNHRESHREREAGHDTLGGRELGHRAVAKDRDRPSRLDC